MWQHKASRGSNFLSQTHKQNVPGIQEWRWRSGRTGAARRGDLPASLTLTAPPSLPSSRVSAVQGLRDPASLFPPIQERELELGKVQVFLKEVIICPLSCQKGYKDERAAKEHFLCVSKTQQGATQRRRTFLNSWRPLREVLVLSARYFNAFLGLGLGAGWRGRWWLFFITAICFV